jgi:hypothetical protein
MTNKSKFQYRILKKYGVLPVFDGDVDRVNVRSPLCDGETFSNWCERVVGKNPTEVLVYQLERPAGQKHIENMRNGGKELLALFRAHARNILQKKSENSNAKASEDEFDFDDFSDLENEPLENPDSSRMPWYVVLSNLKNPESVKCCENKNYTLSEHENFDDYSDEYGDAARNLIVLNDISQYIEKLSHVFSLGNMDRASAAADELVEFIENSSEIDALKAELSEAIEADRGRIQHQHVKLFLGEDLCHELYHMIDDMFFEFEDELESLNQAEEFIGRLLIVKSQSALRDCVDFLREL